MPAWLIAILVGLGSGLAGTLLRINHERGAELRIRMLDAADDFVAATTRALSALGEAFYPLQHLSFMREHVTDSDAYADEERTAEAVWEIARVAWLEAAARVPRITLLYGVGSPAAQASTRASDALGEAVVRLGEFRASDLSEIGARRDPTSAFVLAETPSTVGVHLAEFSTAARAELVGWAARLRAMRHLGRGATPAADSSDAPRT